MSLIDEILQGIPINSLLREKVTKLDADKAAVETENSILKDDLREAKAEIAKLNQQIEKLTHKAPVDEMELEFLKAISANDRLTDEQIAAILQLNLQRVRYHLQRLRELGYLERSRTLINNANPHRLTQDGRGFLIANGLL